MPSAVTAAAARVGGALAIDPACNPAILDTLTWDEATAAVSVAAPGENVLAEIGRAIQGHRQSPDAGPSRLTVHAASASVQGATLFVLAELADGQHVILEFRTSGDPSRLGEPIRDIALADRRTVAVHAASAHNVHAYVRDIAPVFGPRALGETPRLGVGNRMTTACWPAVFRAMNSRGFSANAIQNSVRELNFLDDLVEGRPAERNYYSGFGMIETGHTGSTFEGLWMRGVVEAMKRPPRSPYGADADHLQVKRGVGGLARARRYIDSCRRYTFFTIDLADILEYGALGEPSDSAAARRAAGAVDNEGLLREVIAYHRRPPAGRRAGGRAGQRGGPGPSGSRLPEPTINRLIGKYWVALEALAEVNAYVRSVRDGEPYDLEFTIDEHPPEIPAFDCLTSDDECRFVLGEIGRRGLPVTHLAPNVGVEKGFDYRGADGLHGLERRLASLAGLAADCGVVIDIHSADDLSAATRATIRRATGGRLHYKVSPMPQLLFAEVLERTYPEFFREWWEDAVAYAREEASAGSSFAASCLAEIGQRADGRPSRRDQVFHHYGFRFVGRRDARGRFVNRERFHTLPDEFYRDCEDELASYLEGLAADLLV